MSYGSTWEQCWGASLAAPTPPLTLSSGLSHPHPCTTYLTAWPVEVRVPLGGLDGRIVTSPPPHRNPTRSLSLPSCPTSRAVPPAL